MGALPDLPAIQHLAGLGGRFVAWKLVQRDGKPTKVPFTRKRKAASSTDPASWRSFEDAQAVNDAIDGNGVGFVFDAARDGIGGVDLDACRDPSTGVIADWAAEIIADFKSYTEVSPSGTGVKIYASADPPPTLGRNKVNIDAPAPGGCDKQPQIEAYTTGRYFALTGQHLDGTPDTIEDATEAWYRLARRLFVVDDGPKTQGDVSLISGGSPPAPPPEPADLSALPDLLRRTIEGDPKLSAAWATPTKLTGGGDRTASGLDFSLMTYLAWQGHDDALIEGALRAHPFGQIASGAKTGGAASRMIARLLKKAGEIREKADKREATKGWFDKLLTSEQGTPRDCLANGVIALREDPALVERLAFDEHRGAVMCRDMPWKPGSDWREWQNVDDLRFAEWLQVREVPLKPTTCADAAAAVADDNPNHPIRNWLDGLVWDGVRRLETWLSTYLGAAIRETGDDAEKAKARARYIQEVGLRWLISGVARIYQPGAKVDHALVLEGKQGARKSSALRALMPTGDWFADEISDLGSKDAAQDLRGKWLIELAELSALRRSDLERTKAFMSRAVDHYRPSYGRRTQDFPRQCFFAGTTNADTYLADETGNRRFWPVKVGTIDLDALRRDRDQLWAEAVAAYRAGEIWWLPSDVEALAAEHQAERRIDDPWEGVVLGHTLGKAEVKVSSILSDTSALGLTLDRQDQHARNRVARILRSNGWERHKKRLDKVKFEWVYRPVPSSPADVPSSGGASGNRKAQEDEAAVAPVPSVPSVPSISLYVGTNGAGRIVAEGSDTNTSQIKSYGKEWEQPGTLGTSLVDWTDDRHWLGQLGREDKRDKRLVLLAQWVAAAGGDIKGDTITLPPRLTNGPALVGIRNIAAQLRLTVRPAPTVF